MNVVLLMTSILAICTRVIRLSVSRYGALMCSTNRLVGTDVKQPEIHNLSIDIPNTPLFSVMQPIFINPARTHCNRSVGAG
ncbi:hypothetical protein BDW22DRAFT_500943 [Trametopsis cervina]|nr:hypothetical protein BDW22DRAFT_500943 [Trametopsis cervina]